MLRKITAFLVLLMLVVPMFADTSVFAPQVTSTGLFLTYDSVNRTVYLLNQSYEIVNSQLLTTAQAATLESGWPSSISQLNLFGGMVVASTTGTGSSTGIVLGQFTSGISVQSDSSGRLLSNTNTANTTIQGQYFKPYADMPAQLTVNSQTITGVSTIKAQSLELSNSSVESGSTVGLGGKRIKLSNGTRLKQGSYVQIKPE